MCSTTTRIGLVSDSRRTRQQVGQQQSALGLKARFNPCRDSAACTIVMRWPRRLKSYFSDEQTLYSCITIQAQPCPVHVLCEHLPPTDESACNPNRRAYAILLMWRATFWRTTTPSYLSCEAMC